MSADPVSDVVHCQRADTLDASDFIFHQPIQFVEVGRPRQLAPDSLKPCLDLFQESARNPALMRMTLAAWQLAKRGLADRRRRTALDSKESHLCARTVAVFVDIVAYNFVESHGCS